MSPAVNSALFWIAAASCIVAQLALVSSAIRAPMATPTEPASMRMPRRGTEIAWTIVPAIGLAILLVFTWRETHRAAAAQDPHAGHHMIEE
jgi:heme/copper-type cytochrome/quinol oxidase subunit 2